MSDYIKREDVLLAIWKNSAEHDLFFSAIILDAIKDLPAADVVERKRGLPLTETREQIDGKPRWYRKHLCCANCGTQIRLESWTESRCFGAGTILRENEMPNYCPNCGAELREES